MRLTFQQGTDARCYNLPTVEEVATIVPGDGSENVREHREIILCTQGGGLRCISHLHPSYLCLHYVLLFPQGEAGWHLDIPLQNENGRPQRSKKIPQCSKKITQLLWSGY